MPAIKKKWIKASQDGDVPEEIDSEEALGDEDRELTDGASATDNLSKIKKPKKRSAPLAPYILRGLDGEVLLEKRKRLIPPSEQKLLEWIDANLETRTEETVHLPSLYAYYTELCQGDVSEVLDIQNFSRMVREKCGKNFGIKETSIYKSIIKERKINKEKKKSSGIKMKEIVHEAINHFGNPWAGVRAFALKQYLGSKYPALQIDLKPKLLKRYLDMGVQYNQIELVKGIGMAGYYRLPGAKPPSPTKPKETKSAEGEDKEKDTDESAEEGKESAAEDQAPKSSEENGEKHEESGEESKKKKHKPKKTEKVTYSHIRHGLPEKMEDIFPLAITYQSAPKTAGTARIRRYIQEKYEETVTDHRWRKAIESGVEKGYWEYVSGSGLGGKLHLLMDDFDPSSEQIEDRICAAIIACHEPKAASANQIKKYISQYHPDFKVDERPDSFRKALQRAVSKNFLVQLSGLGATGSFQLTASFIPSPLILAGEDDSEDEGVGYDSDEPVYVSKGTKSRGIPKVKTMEVMQPSPSKSKKSKRAPAAPTSPGRNKGKKSSYAEESDQSEDEQPVKKSKKSSKSKPVKKSARGKRITVSTASSEEEEQEEDEPEYTPKKSQSRGGVTEAPSVKINKLKGKQAAKLGKPDKSEAKSTAEEKSSKTVNKNNGESQSKRKGKTSPPVKSARSLNKTEGKDSETASSDEEKNEVSSKKRDEPQSKKKSKLKNSDASFSFSKKRKLDDSEDEKDEADSNDDDEEREYTPRKSKSRGGSALASANLGKSESKRSSAKPKTLEAGKLDIETEQESSAKTKSGDDAASSKKKGRARKAK
ncbi:hypothetical protein Btru_071430 [Bulinus truncatus]|nr:hypothetical protein Btru_071430 [Bulinus truncatus]